LSFSNFASQPNHRAKLQKCHLPLASTLQYVVN
jgi:hypothetical protein